MDEDKLAVHHCDICGSPISARTVLGFDSVGDVDYMVKIKTRASGQGTSAEFHDMSICHNCHRDLIFNIKRLQHKAELLKGNDKNDSCKGLA